VLKTRHNFPPRLRTVLFIWALILLNHEVLCQIPSGYYNAAAGKTGEALQIALYNIIKGHTVVSYTPGVWDAIYSTDLKANGKIWDMYSDIPGGIPPYEYEPGTDQCGTGGGGIEGDCYSREHSFPKSWFNDVSPMNTDLFHIFPTDQYVNNMHSNLPFAVVGAILDTSLNGCKKGACATPGYTGTVFEPIDAYKGDFARAYFYMATRYENVIATWPVYDPIAAIVMNGTAYPAFQSWYVNMLIQWSSEDPVSAKEIARNDSVFKIQHNRNPFIDHPEYVMNVWMPGGPKPEPTGHATGFTATTGVPAYSALQLSWTDAIGSVTPDGYLIRGSSTGFSSISAPVDGIPVADGGLDINIGSTFQTCSFTGLLSNTVYYFKIFPYTNAGNIIDYKTGEPVPTASDTTVALQPGDIAIIEANSSDPDRLSFITFKQLNSGTVITFTDNGFTDPTTVRTGEGFLIYTAPAVVPAGTVVSYYNGMTITGTGWNSANPSNFQLATAGDQVFAYQGVWGAGQTLLFGVNFGNGGWLISGAASSNLSYFPIGLTSNSTAITFSEKNGNYNLITAGSANALGSLIANSVNWTKSASNLPTPAWSFTITPNTVINQNATAENFTVGSGENVTILPGIQLTVNGNLIISASD
jgi:endonuclease I